MTNEVVIEIDPCDPNHKVGEPAAGPYLIKIFVEQGWRAWLKAIFSPKREVDNVPLAAMGCQKYQFGKYRLAVNERIEVYKYGELVVSG